MHWDQHPELINTRSNLAVFLVGGAQQHALRAAGVAATGSSRHEDVEASNVDASNCWNALENGWWTRIPISMMSTTESNQQIFIPICGGHLFDFSLLSIKVLAVLPILLTVPSLQQMCPFPGGC